MSEIAGQLVRELRFVAADLERLQQELIEQAEDMRRSALAAVDRREQLMRLGAETGLRIAAARLKGPIDFIYRNVPRVYGPPQLVVAVDNKKPAVAAAGPKRKRKQQTTE